MIASTGNKITDRLARASKAAQGKEAAAKSKAKKAAKAGARMKKVSAGRQAIKNGKAGGGGGKGIVVKMQKSGSGFGGMLNYGLNKPEAQIISSNCGFDQPSILRDMIRCAEQKKIKKPVGHITFSLPPTTQIGDEKWRAIIDFARSEIDLDDSFSYVAILHRDADHAHIHLIFSRVSDQGEVHNDYRLGLRLAGLEDLIEDKFSLPLVPVNRAINFTRGEIERALDKGIQPDRQQLNQIVMRASSGKPSVTEFISRCAAEGVVVRPNIASTGKLNGFAFSLVDSGVEFKGSKIGCGWSKLQEMGVRYEQDTEASVITDLAAQLEQGQRTDDSDQSAPASVGAMGEEIEGTDRATEKADRTAQVTDRSAQVRVEEVVTASPDPVRHAGAGSDRLLVPGTQTVINADQQEPAPIDREAFEQIKRDLYSTNGSEEARAAAEISMNWAQQSEIRQVIKNIDAFNKRMRQATAAPAVQGDQHIALPTM